MLAIAVGASQGLAASNDSSVAVKVYRHADPFANCPPTTGKKEIGTAVFTLAGSTLKVSIKLHGADPGQYFVALWTAKNPCAWTGNLYGKFKVDSSGDGSVTFTASSVSGTHFFVDVFNETTNQSNGTAVANL